MMNGVVFTALAVAALTALLAIVPLTAPRPLGAEIAVENFLDQRVRPQITRLEIIPFVPATDRLQPGEARGLIGREVITSVTALSKEGGTELQLRSERDLVVMVVEVGRDQVTAIRVLDQPVDLSSVRFDLHADDGRWQGRITWQNGHVVLVAP
jgi:hypothetical protein